jgi:hypothetical protein
MIMVICRDYGLGCTNCDYIGLGGGCVIGILNCCCCGVLCCDVCGKRLPPGLGDCAGPSPSSAIRDIYCKHKYK